MSKICRKSAQGTDARPAMSCRKVVRADSITTLRDSAKRLAMPLLPSFSGLPLRTAGKSEGLAFPLRHAAM